MLILARTYRPVLRRLAARFETATLEMPGSGGGSRLRTPWGFNQYASWLARCLERLPGPPPVLTGHSNSAPVALLTATIRPELISGLILIDPVGILPRKSVPRLMWRRLIDSLLEPRLTLTGWPHLLYNLLRHTGNFLHQVRLCAHADLAGSMDTGVPTLIGWGALDHTTPVSAADVLRSQIPGSRLYVSSRGSHDWIIERPEEFARVVTGFARQLDRTRVAQPTRRQPPEAAPLHRSRP